MKLQYIATVAAASLLSTSLVGVLPSNANASSLRGSTIIVADGHGCAGSKPCAAAENPCAANPCASAENPCASPCAGAKNPCAAAENPCAGS